MVKVDSAVLKSGRSSKFVLPIPCACLPLRGDGPRGFLVPVFDFCGVFKVGLRLRAEGDGSVTAGSDFASTVCGASFVGGFFTLFAVGDGESCVWPGVALSVLRFGGMVSGEKLERAVGAREFQVGAGAVTVGAR